MVITPIQRFGIGDIIFEQTAVRKIAGENPIVWPVEGHFAEGINRAYPDIHFRPVTQEDNAYDRRIDFIDNGVRYLPLRWADSLCGVPYKDCMKSKYMLYSQNWETWKEKAMWTRDKAKEDELYNLLNPQDNPYILVNRFFGSNSQLQANIQVSGIDMKSLAGYSLFDWAKVIENATEIHTVSTSIIYLLELLDLKAKEIHLYKRLPIETHFRNIDYILQKHKYIFH